MVVPIVCELPERPGAPPGLQGMLRVRVIPDSIAGRAYGREDATENFGCRYGLNSAYRDLLERGGIRITGFSEDGEVRIVELTGHPFYVATAFRPQLSSQPGRPHPLILAYVEAVSAAAEALLPDCGQEKDCV